MIEKQDAAINLRWSLEDGFVLVALDRKSGRQTLLSLDPSEMDVIAAGWPAFRDRNLPAAPAPNAEGETRSPIANRDGRAATSSGSSSPDRNPPSTSSGGGTPSTAIGRDNGAAPSREEQKTLL